jgi:hypothetical protein
MEQCRRGMKANEKVTHRASDFVDLFEQIREALVFAY